jgi:heat shock protein HslJ
MKQFGILAVVAVVLLVGGVLLSNYMSSESDDVENVISRNGIHWHPELEIYVHGEKVEIQEGIGLVGVHNPIHTHDDLPLVHMEFSGKVTKEDTTLGEFFKVWGKEFNSKRLFDNHNGPEGMVHMFVNGKENTEFENYHMQDKDKIEIRYELAEVDSSSITLEMKRWVWISTIYDDGEELKPKKAGLFSILFSTDGTFSATTDCNDMSGNHSVNGNNINFGRVIQSLKYCEESQEEDFATILREARKFSFTAKEELIVELEVGVAVFR